MKSPYLIAVATVLALQGCAFAPGQHLDTASLQGGDADDQGRVELVPITPKLLSIQQALRKKEGVPADLLSYKPEPYRVGPNDTLQVTVWEHPELTNPAGLQQQTSERGSTVQPDGSFYFPYVGKIQVAGMTVEEVRTALTQRLSAWIVNPQLEVAVANYQSAQVQLSGAFAKNEPLPITHVPLTLFNALGKAGIKVGEADPSGFTLTRDGREYRLDIDELERGNSKLAAIYLKAGDHIHLPYKDRRRAYVFGEVSQPTAILFDTRSVTLLDAIGRAGGLRQETSNANAVYVIRGAEEIEQRPAQVFQLEAKSPVAFTLASQFEVRPQDVVYVGPAGITRWNRFISQLLPTNMLMMSGVNTSNALQRR